MKKSQHRHRDRRRLKRARLASSLRVWRVWHSIEVARIHAMPPGSTKSLAISMMERLDVIRDRVIAGIKEPFPWRNA